MVMSYRTQTRIVLDVLLSLLVTLQVTHAGTIQSYCQWEAFNATCPDGHVIMMKSAEYGRMRVGRCLSTDYFTGCQANVLDHMDERCSGRQSCNIQIPDPVLFNVQPCRKDLMAYLEADYECIKVADPNQDKKKKTYCRGPITLSTKDRGYILSSVTVTSNLGSRSCPWLIKVKPGQKINITLYDFSTRTSGDATPKPNNVNGVGSKSFCPVHALLKEGESLFGPSQASAKVAVCGSERRRRWLYTTRGTSLLVQLVNMSQSNYQDINFMLKYEVVGCADLKNPTHARMERKGDSLMISCNSSLETWHLVCKGTSWIGDYHNCSSGTTTCSSVRMRQNLCEGSSASRLSNGLLKSYWPLVPILLSFVHIQIRS